MNIKKILLTTILASNAFAMQNDQFDYCPGTRVFIDILKNCKDIESCKSSCHMLSNIAIASSADSGMQDQLNEFELTKKCDSIDESKIALTKAWANALIETAEYKRKLENC
ncbi:MAG: hypothetical protein VX835_04550 [Pseudomonadota bacterium]|nr:hypothetical protein [Pseudomonadota bacterium]